MSAKPVPVPRLFVIIPVDVQDRLVPQRSEAFGLYSQLVKAVTCEVAHDGKQFGLVLGGAAMSQGEWAKRFRMSERSMQRALAVLKGEGLAVVHRRQHDTQLAITDSVKRTKRRGKIHSYPWLIGLPDPPDVAELAANMADLAANMAELDDAKNLQLGEDATTCKESRGREKKVEKKVEESSGADASGNQSSASPTPKPKFTYFPSDFTPSHDNLALANKLGVDLVESLPAFKDHHLSKGDRSSDWNKSLNGWLRNERKYGQPKWVTTGSLTDNQRELEEKYQ
jgi:hypothetical protein